MKKALLFALLLLLPMGFSCYNNSINISADNDLERVYAMLLFEQRYNYFDNNSFSYYALNDSGVKLKVSNESIIIQLNEISSEAGDAIRDELYSLWIYNATSLSEEDIIFISNAGSFGEYKNGQLADNNSECSEEIIIPSKDGSGMLAILVATLPFIVILGYYARLDYKKYLAFFIGGLLWVAALILRLPLLGWASMSESIWILLLIPSALAGIFEETVRFIALKFVETFKKNFFLFAMGWSFFEVAGMYCTNILYYLVLNQGVSFIDALPGLIERFSATVLHLAFTIIVLKSVHNKKLLALAISLHAGVNLFGVLLLALNINVWIIEIALVFIAFWFYYLANELKEGEQNDKGRSSKKNKGKK